MKPYVSLDVIGLRSTFRIQAIVDTGFTEELSLPTEIAVALGLELRGTQKFILADGSIRKELAFSGRVRFLDAERDVEIVLSELDEALIGTALLEDCRLTIDFVNETVELKKAKRKSPRRS